MNRRIDELGRLCIPKEMRNKLGIKDNDPVNIECIENKIIITNPDTIDYKQKLDKVMGIIELNQYSYGYQIKEEILKGE